MTSLEIPTKKPGVVLKEADGSDDIALMEAGRPYVLHPHLPPTDKRAPDHEAYVRLQKLRKNEDPYIKRFALWDKERFVSDAFIGFGFLIFPQEDSGNAPGVDFDIMRKYRTKEYIYNYGGLAVRALTTYLHEDMGVSRVVADTHPLSKYSRETFEKVGFVAVRAIPGHILYEDIQEVKAFSQEKQEEKVLVANER